MKLQLGKGRVFNVLKNKKMYYKVKKSNWKKNSEEMGGQKGQK